MTGVQTCALPIYYRYYEQGEISDGWFERMRGILAVMVERGRVSQAQADAVSKPRFP